MQDKDICYSCKYRKTCRQDMTNLFMNSKRTGASLVNVLVFFLVALMITAQAFFFLSNSAESVAEEREMMQIQLKLDELVDEAKEALEGIDSNLTSISMWGNYQQVYDEYYSLFSDSSSDDPPGAKRWKNSTDDAAIFDLYYTFMSDGKTHADEEFQKNEVNNLYRKIYPAMGKNYFLIRARVKLPTGNYIMRQVVIEKYGTDLYTRSSEEVYYW